MNSRLLHLPLLAVALVFGSMGVRAQSPADTSTAKAKRPNILFLFADDQRYDTLGCTGHPVIKTPAIDALAAEGVRFQNAFVTTSVCWVSRATVLTGQWARTHAMRDSVPTVKLESLAKMFPLELHKAGYRTGHFGKWHMIMPPGFRPEEQYDVYEAVGRNPYIKTLADGTKRHETDIICDRGIEFIKSQPKDQPFCLNLWFNAAHAEDGDKRPGIGHYPWPASTDGMYEDVKIPAPRLGEPAIYESQPEFLKQSINRERFFWGYDTPEKYETNVRAYFRMISGIDKAVARVLQGLKEAGLDDNTIIVYTADNGYYLGDRGFQGKWSHYDESLRVPMVIYDPRLPKEKRGRVLDEMVLNVDLATTFLDWAGVQKPAGYQGSSLAPLVRGEEPASWRDHFFCEHLDLAPTLTWEGVRGQRYMYARYIDQPAPSNELLYDLKADKDELRDVAADAAHADALEEMRALCNQEMDAKGGALPPMDQRGYRKNAPGKKPGGKKGEAPPVPTQS